MKIAVFEVEPWETKAFSPLLKDHELLFFNEALTLQTLENLKQDPQFQSIEIISTFIYSDLSAPILEAFPKLKLVTTRSTGFDHIDLKYCNQHQIAVCNVPTYGDETVAEHVFGLLLNISHHLTEAIDRTRRGDFSLHGLRGFDLRGKTLGVIGTGNIGKCVIEIAKGFRMNVIAYDQKPSPKTAESLGFAYKTLDELFATADIITLHIPGNASTHHLINEAAFAKMKQGVVFINTARGSIVEVQALLQALSTGKVAAAGLDVLPEEPAIREEAELLRSFFKKQHNLETLLADHILLRMRNVIITPHSAFNTQEALERILETTVENIQNFAHKKPVNQVNRESELRETVSAIH
ncbi:MAG: hydroxyacid dehydrogenase [Cyanobacteria bacterium]|nr:hydroxyacid dehydrogenase [Cyanobacteriota bacterium]